MWLTVFSTAALSCTSPEYIYQFCSSCSPLSFTHGKLCKTLGQFEDLVWSVFTCRPIYEQCGAVHTFITSSSTGAVRDLLFMNWQWVSFSSLRWVCWLDRMNSVYMSDSPGHDSLPSLRLLPAMTFEPPVFCTGQFCTLLEIMVRSAIQHVVNVVISMTIVIILVL